MTPRRNHIGNALPRLRDLGKADQQRARLGRRWQDAQRHLRNNPEQPFGTDHQPEQIKPRRVERAPADLQHLAFDRHQLDAEDIVRRQPIFEAMHPARVLGDIAADRARDLARRIGPVIKAARRDRLAHRKIGHAWLHDRDAFLIINLNHAVKPRHAEQYAIGQRQRAARKRSSRAARDNFNPLARTIGEDC